MTPDQVELLKTTWRAILPNSTRAGELFYARLFEEAPGLRALFKGDLPDQCERFVTMLGSSVDALDTLDAFLPTLRDLGRRHRNEFGVKDEDYDTFRDALVWTLQRTLGMDLTPEAEEAWTAFYDLLAETMKQGAHPKP